MTNRAWAAANVNILVVDDTPDNLRVLSASLGEQGYQVRCAKSGEMALTTAKKQPPHLILLDIKMPGMDGYEVCRQLKADTRTQEIPVIFLSAMDDVLDKVQAFQAGAVDYVTKPFHEEEMVLRVRHQLDLQFAKAEIKQLNLDLEQKVLQRTLDLEKIVHQLNQEVAQHEKTQEKLSQQALHDDLTGLPNRVLFLEHLQRSLQRRQRNPDYLFAVCFIDLDRFKLINDRFGHVVGDQLLKAIALILKSCVREGDIVARLSGDEFTILLEDLQEAPGAMVSDRPKPDGQQATAIAIAERLLNQLRMPIALESQSVFAGASIGIVFGTSHYLSSIEILRDADIAMYHAKATGKGCYAVFDQQMYQQIFHLSQTETDLRYALERHEFCLHYQPILSLNTDQIAGFEVLLRWQHPAKGLIYPGDFIEIAEETGLIVPMGEWVLREAAHQLAAWQQHYPFAAQVHLSVNLSSRQLKQFDFVGRLTRIVAETGINAAQLRLELTETMLMDQREKTIELLDAIKAQQVQLSIDDFGTGYSSLSYLHRFPIDALKIDRSFVSPMDTEGNNREIVNTIITLAHSLGMKAIAEGVETQTQLEQLQHLGCDEAQGYFIAEPLWDQQVEAILNEGPSKISNLG
jgi:diguanylate cyclase (GGDEF)-like protein